MRFFFIIKRLLLVFIIVLSVPDPVLIWNRKSYLTSKLMCVYEETDPNFYLRSSLLQDPGPEKEIGTR